jgi:hypothetical protein
MPIPMLLLCRFPGLCRLYEISFVYSITVMVLLIIPIQQL